MFRPAIAEGRFTAFLTSYIHEAALRPSSRGSGEKGSEEERVLRQKAFLLVHRIYLISIFAWNKLSLELRTGEFLLDLCNAFPKSKTLGALLSKVGAENEVALREAFKDLRINILGELPSTKKTPPKNRLAKENELAHRIHSLAVLFLVSVTAAEEFITGSDFLDSLIEVFENLDKKSKLRSEILRAVHAVHYALLGSGDNDGDGDSNGDGGEGNEKGRADGGRKINYRLLLDEMNQLLLRGPGSKEHNFLEALVNETTYLRMLNKHIPFAPPEAVPKIAALKNSLEKNHQSTTSGRKPKRPIRGKVEKQKGNKGKNKAEVDEETEVQNVMMDEYVRHVKEMFPELQDDWVREMLEQHRGNVDAVVRELLEQRLVHYHLIFDFPIISNNLLISNLCFSTLESPKKTSLNAVTSTTTTPSTPSPSPSLHSTSAARTKTSPLTNSSPTPPIQKQKQQFTLRSLPSTLMKMRETILTTLRM